MPVRRTPKRQAHACAMEFFFLATQSSCHVSDHKFLLIAHNHNQVTRLHNGPCDPRRKDVRLLVKFVEEKLALTKLVQRRTRNSDLRDEVHVPRNVCRLRESVEMVLSP